MGVDDIDADEVNKWGGEGISFLIFPILAGGVHHGESDCAKSHQRLHQPPTSSARRKPSDSLSAVGTVDAAIVTNELYLSFSSTFP